MTTKVKILCCILTFVPIWFLYRWIRLFSDYIILCCWLLLENLAGGLFSHHILVHPSSPKKHSYYYFMCQLSHKVYFCWWFLIYDQPIHMLSILQRNIVATTSCQLSYVLLIIKWFVECWKICMLCQLVIAKLQFQFLYAIIVSELFATVS
jgi:hypothetical protein